MGIKFYRPTSNGRRSGSVLDYAEITKVEPEKSLLEAYPSNGGRNNHGHITRRHSGGGNKRMYRKVDFKRDKDGIPAKVAAIEYDPCRTAFIALLHYADGEKRYILAPQGVKVGQTLVSGKNVEPQVGNSMPLGDIPVGLEIHNIELGVGRGGQLVRSAGGWAQLQAKEGAHAI